MRKWQFYVETPREILGGITFDRKDTDVFVGTEDEAREELQKRLAQTWSPFVIHGFNPA